MSTIVFLHGLESRTDASGKPIGGKARWLESAWSATLPALDTSHARAAIASGVRDPAALAPTLATPVARAMAALTPHTRAVVGSSFGGGVLLRLLGDGAWTGPSLLLAATVRFTPDVARLPTTSGRLLWVHATADAVVPVDDARRLTATRPDAVLWEVDDDHRLGASLADGTLEHALRAITSRSAAWPPLAPASVRRVQVGELTTRRVLGH